jgi:hypothetical protein
MRQRILLPWVVGFAFAVAAASMNCGGDDNNGTTGTGTAGGSTGGKAGSGGSGGTPTTTTAGGKGGGGTGGTGGSGGSAGSAGAGGGGRGGSGGAGGTAGSAGSGGQKDAGDGGPETGTTDAKPDSTDAPSSSEASDAPATDAAPDTTTSDAPDGSVAFAAVAAIFTQRCITCHSAGAPRIDLITPVGLYTRLTSPLPDNQEGKCGFPSPDAGDDGGDGGDGAVPPNRQPIVPGNTDASLLYLKVSGTQPTGCGQRMPRVLQFNDDGGSAGSVGCNVADGGATANCLSQADLDTIRNWIIQGAPNN